MVSINLKRADLPIKWHFTSWSIWCHSHWIKSNCNVIPFPEQIPLQGLIAQKCLTLCWLPRGLSRKLGVQAESAELLPCWTQPSLPTSGSTEMPRYLRLTPAGAWSSIWVWAYTSESEPEYTQTSKEESQLASFQHIGKRFFIQVEKLQNGTLTLW